MKLSELRASFEAHKAMQEYFEEKIGGGEWIVSFQAHCNPFKFTVWRVEDNKGALPDYALLTTTCIENAGMYTCEELQPLLDKIKELSQ